VQHLIDLRFNVPFWERGNFPATISNGSQQVALQNPWQGRPNSAPFDQPFYLILDVAVGGTNGWFPDDTAEKGAKKPWFNGAFGTL